MEDGGRNDWISRLRAEDPDAAAAFPEPEPVPAELSRPFYQLYWRAWAAIRHDRQYGAFSGESRISYSVIRQYAADHHISGDDFQTFIAAMRGIDEEWLVQVASRQKSGTKTP